MSTIGIDYQATLTLLALREGNPGSARINDIGDGARGLMPNIASSAGGWASACLSSEDGGQFRGRPGPEGIWLEEPGASLFWRGLAGRLRHFLGGIPPTPENGYEPVVALSAGNYASAAEGVRELARSAGLSDIECIRAGEALLCHWLTNAETASASSLSVVAVVCSDSLTLVSAHRLEPGATGRWQIISGDSEIVLPAGHCAWAGRVLAGVRERRSQALAPPLLREEIALEEAALAFASRLSAAEPNHAIEWQGPFRENSFTNFRLAPVECRSWAEVALLHDQLPQAVRQAAAGVSRGVAPDFVVLGGIGAMWPFARDALARFGGVITTSPTERSLARGAAWWPWFRDDFAARVRGQQAPAGPREDRTPSPRSEEMCGPGEDAAPPPLRPPWER